ncbi:hypothetical protein ABIB81_006077 [Bradyrhizobium sp. I1.7.5]
MLPGHRFKLLLNVVRGPAADKMRHLPTSIKYEFPARQIEKAKSHHGSRAFVLGFCTKPHAPSEIALKTDAASGDIERGTVMTGLQYSAHRTVDYDLLTPARSHTARDRCRPQQVRCDAKHDLGVHHAFWSSPGTYWRVANMGRLEHARRCRWRSVRIRTGVHRQKQRDSWSESPDLLSDLQTHVARYAFDR